MSKTENNALSGLETGADHEEEGDDPQPTAGTVHSSFDPSAWRDSEPTGRLAEQKSIRSGRLLEAESDHRSRFRVVSLFGLENGNTVPVVEHHADVGFLLPSDTKGSPLYTAFTTKCPG